MSSPLPQQVDVAYVLIALLVGTVNWILSEILRASNCRFNSVGHWVITSLNCGANNYSLDLNRSPRITIENPESTPMVITVPPCDTQREPTPNSNVDKTPFININP